MSTTDPGMEDELKQKANDIEKYKSSDEEEEMREEEDLKQPTQWWFASTACPLLAGTFGPIASGFNVCSLAYRWRQYIPPGDTEIEGEQGGYLIKDPGWEVAINAISLVAALTGNMWLLLNMARRAKFSIAQPMTIAGFLLAGILLIADLAAIGGSPHYLIQIPKAIPDARHALTGAYYYAIWAAAIYMIIGFLMCLTVYGAYKGHYDKEFRLTPPQRTLMLQTMSFIIYLMVGALVFSHVEGWEYLDAVYWADVTLLTIGLGDYAPATKTGRGLLFPFAIGGILMVGLVVGSIRSLVLERGEQKMSARIVEQRRSKAVNNVDDRKQTIKISMFSQADFSVDPDLSPAQRREEEFNVMRKVQDAAEKQRRYMALAMSSSFALILWFVGAAIFQQTEVASQWTYFESLYFAYTSLLTIGYGTPSPSSNSGKAFFVVWSLLAIPALTILISDMGDTVVKWFSDITMWVGSFTVLPGERGFRVGMREAIKTLVTWTRDSFSNFTGPGLFGAGHMKHKKRMPRTDYENHMLDSLAERLTGHIDDDPELDREEEFDDLDRDIMFYHYVLARECRNVAKDMNADSGKRYDWGDWEYYLRLMGNQEDPVDYPGQEVPDIMVPAPLRAPGRLGSDETPTVTDEGPYKRDLHLSKKSGGNSDDAEEKKGGEPADSEAKDTLDGNVDRQTSLLEKRQQKNEGKDKRKQLRRRVRRQKNNPDGDDDDYLHNWSWLSDESPLMSQKSEPEWILSRLSAALERELNRQRKGYRNKPPVGLKDAKRREKKEVADVKKDDAQGGVEDRTQHRLEEAAKGEA